MPFFNYCYLILVHIAYVFVQVEGFDDEDILIRKLLTTNSNSNDDDDSGSYPTIDSSVYRICANNSFSDNNVDIPSTLYTCVSNMVDPLCVPSYLNRSNVTDVRVAYKFNNLMSVAEIDMTATIDFFFRLYWVDERFNMPELWDTMARDKPELILDGIELGNLIRDRANPLAIWMPNIYITNAKQIDFMAETIRLRPGGLMFWSRHAVATLQQSRFSYHRYPQDSQQIIISAQSYGLNKNFVSVNFTGTDAPLIGYGLPSPVSFITIDDMTNFKANPLWTYSSYTTVVYNPNYGSTKSGATKDTLFVYLNIQRQSSGIIYRLAVPIMLLLLLVGLTFWSDYKARVDTTISILLAISALYIVIFSSIPLLGYLTDFDTYIITMFFMIILAVFLHQISSRLKAKEGRYPLRLLALRGIEIAGKVLVIPGVLVSFFWTFTEIDMMGWVRDAMTALCICAASYILMRESVGFRQDLAKATTLLRLKMAREDQDRSTASAPLTSIEVLFVNLQAFGVVSTSTALFQQQERQQSEGKEKWEDNDVYADGIEMQPQHQREHPTSTSTAYNAGGGGSSGTTNPLL